MERISLNGAWEMKAVQDDRWLEARVPGSVVSDLLNAGVMQDPFFRDHEKTAKRMLDNDFVYRRSFSLPESFLAHDRILLRCHGLDTLAQIRVNGKWAADVDNMHRTWEIDVQSLVRAGDNAIEIRFESAQRFIAKKQAEKPLFSPSHAMAGLPYIRKSHSMFGWDSDPQIPDAGIWKEIELLGLDGARLSDAFVRQTHGQGVSLAVDLEVERFAPCALSACLTLVSPDGETSAQTIPVSGGTAQGTFWVERPRLWWPNGYGGQPLYTLTIELYREEELLESRQIHVGLRTVRVRREADQWGESFAFEVNGKAIFAKGACYIPEDKFLSRCSKEKTERLLRDCQEANFNCIRVWGGGIFPFDDFFDACDRLGILVWQDFMFACATYPVDDAFLENIHAEIADNVRRLRHHACLALWCGNNELNTLLTHPHPLKTDQDRLHYIQIFETLIPQWMKTLDPDTFYWPTSPSSGMYFENPQGWNKGDVHYWPVWHQNKPYTAYREVNARFVSEFGIQSFPDYKTVCEYTLPQERNLCSYVMDLHQKNQDHAGNAKIIYYVMQDLPYPQNTRDAVYASQIVQAEAMRCGVEYWRSNRGRCMGALYWQLNDCWPAPTWAGIDSAGRWKALHYVAKRFFAPLAACAREQEGQVALYAMNETLEEDCGALSWRLCGPDGETVQSGTAQVRIPPLSAVQAQTLDFSQALEQPDARRRLHLEYRLQGNHGQSRGSLLFVKPKHYLFNDPRLHTHVEKTADGFAVHVRAEAFAQYVALDLENADAVFDDNFFDLSSDEEKIVPLHADRIRADLSLEDVRRQLTVRSLFDLF